MTWDRERANELLPQLRRRSHCFDLMKDFFDRADRENNLAGMEAAYDAMVQIHRGVSRS